MLNDIPTAETTLIVPVQGQVIECASIVEAAALRQADHLLTDGGRHFRDPHETAALAAALSKFKQIKIARQLNILANKLRIDAQLGLQQ